MYYFVLFMQWYVVRNCGFCVIIWVGLDSGGGQGKRAEALQGFSLRQFVNGSVKLVFELGFGASPVNTLKLRLCGLTCV